MRKVNRSRGPTAAAVLIIALAGFSVYANEQGNTEPPRATVAPPAPRAGSQAPAPTAARTESADSAVRQQLLVLAKRSFDLERQIDSARLDLASAERRFQAAQKRLDAEADPDPLLRDEVSVRRLQLESGQRYVTLLEAAIARSEKDEESLRRLDAIDRKLAQPEELANWHSESRRQQDALARELAVKRERYGEVRNDADLAAERLREIEPNSPGMRWAQLRQGTIENLASVYGAEIASIELALAGSEALSARIESAQQELPFALRIRGALHYLHTIWNYPLTGGDIEPITLGKVVGAVVLFVIGWVVARLVTRVLGARVFRGLKMEEGAAHAFESLAFYLLLFVAFLTALRMVHIPLTAFAVVGGALAIGVGFGSQNVVNNFISGIILLAERPIKRNDLVEVQGIFGNVEEIGLRSTRVRTGDNIHIIVPNASFLESNVVNWTHSDPKVRVSVAVGVAYGSPAREVERLIDRAVREQEDVLPEPEPVVLFMDFGDNALAFEARFWIMMPTVLTRLRIESDIRHRIDELFREAEISIAFPQRDVHIDTLSPVEVRLVDETAERRERPVA